MNLSLIFSAFVLLGTATSIPRFAEEPLPFKDITMPSSVCEQAFIISGGVCYIWLNPYLDENKKIDELKKLAIMDIACKNILGGKFYFVLSNKTQSFNYFCMRDQTAEQEKYNSKEKIYFAHHT